MTDMPVIKNDYKCDVLVIGAGPAGASLAFFLGGSGLDVILADRKKKIEEPVRCAGYIPANLTGLFDFKLEGLKNSISEMKTYIINPSGSGKIPSWGKMNSCRKISALKAPGYMIDRREMISDWVEKFLKNGGIYMPMTKVTGICKGRVDALRLNDRITIRPKIIAGADGPVSVAGKSIGSQNNRFLAGINCMMSNLAAYKKSTKVFFLPEIKGGYGWAFPGGNYLNIGIGVDLSLYEAAERKDGIIKNTFEHFLIMFENPGIYKDINFNSEITGYVKKTIVSGLIPVSGMLDEPVKGNTVLVGDAAGLCNPVTGAGIYNAVYSSKIASYYILKSLKENNLKILKFLKEQYKKHFGISLNRALDKRHLTAASWNSCSCTDEFENLIRQVWIAFKEYKK